ncbi:hypothetical protein HOLleu_39815 [Holothuria leucospilota]|uniref:Uncharacterized protein n=1 Tax=Holothuria leucospilota TaxID=206669 RepID=A0A9Q0YGX0_HOLLE|nr:hypothetical protein HOLleu_39815 [Holothuria leucospilota]
MLQRPIPGVEPKNVVIADIYRGKYNLEVLGGNHTRLAQQTIQGLTEPKGQCKEGPELPLAILASSSENASAIEPSISHILLPSKLTLLKLKFHKWKYPAMGYW